MDTGAALIEYHKHLLLLIDLRGELAEIEKVDIRQRIQAYEDSNQTTVTGRRYDGDRFAIDSTTEMVEYKMKVAVELDWITFYQTVIRTNMSESERGL